MDDNVEIIKNDEIDLRSLFQVLWSERKLIVRITGIITISGIMYALLATPLYKSTITMYPHSDRDGGLNKLQGMASMFGVNALARDSKFHIPDVINSRTLQTRIIYKKWDTNLFSSPVNLISFWGINNDSEIPLKSFNKSEANMNLKWESSALKKMADRISVNENKTGLININVLMEEPEVSAQIANFIYDAVVEFTNMNHLETAKLNREFIQQRQDEVKEVLISAENSLKVFRSKNRKIIDSPQLQLELERLLRDVEIQAQVFITLQQQYELARIDEVKETPSVIVLDKAFPSIFKYSPNRKMIVFISVFLGLFVGLFSSLLRYTFNGSRYSVYKVNE